MIVKGKRGLSGVVTMVLVILIAIVAIVMIWAFVRPTIESTGGQVGIGSFTTNLEIQSIVSGGPGLLDVKVKRGAGKGELIGVNIILKDAGGNTQLIREDVESFASGGSFGELETEIITVPDTVNGVAEVEEVSIASIIKSAAGQEIIGNIIDSKKVSDVECEVDGDCPGDQCNNGVCNGGICGLNPVVDGTACDDVMSCTNPDTCTGGACGGIPNDGLCDNGQFCDGSETCDAQLGCQVGIPVDCNDGISCTDDSCNEVNDWCDNINNCPGGEFCDVGGSNQCESASGGHVSCGSDCYICDEDEPVDNTIDACTDGNRCNDNLAICQYMWVQNIYVDNLNSDIRFNQGDTVMVNCTIKCWAAGTDWAISYDSTNTGGGNWQVIDSGNCPPDAYPNTPPPTCENDFRNFSTTIVLDSVPGTHAVRCHEYWTAGSGDVCSIDDFRDADDVTFSVV